MIDTNHEKVIQNHLVKKKQKVETEKDAQYHFEGQSNALNAKQEIFHTFMHHGNFVKIEIFPFITFCTSQNQLIFFNSVSFPF